MRFGLKTNWPRRGGGGGGEGGGGQTDLEHTVCFGMESRCEFVSNENTKSSDALTHLGLFTEIHHSQVVEGVRLLGRTLLDVKN